MVTGAEQRLCDVCDVRDEENTSSTRSDWELTLTFVDLFLGLRINFAIVLKRKNLFFFFIFNIGIEIFFKVV